MFGQNWTTIGLGFLIALTLALWAIYNIAGAKKATPLVKAVWTVAVLFIPYLGFFAWLFFGPRADRR